MRGANNTMDTINAAATAIASAENRTPRASVQKRRWASCWSLTSCFTSQKQRKRIGHAVLVPEPIPSRTEASRIERPAPQPSIARIVIAPPSSPASFLHSEPPSATQSPTGPISFTSMSSNIYSSGPPSMFAIGPYAHETQLVSPPVFSTFTTEPSTAPFTPPELLHLTTPSSPEVPFARLLDPFNQNGQRFLLDRQNSDVGPLTSFFNGGRNDENIIDHRVSFEITAEEVIRCVERRRNRIDDASNGRDCRAGETSGSTSGRGSVDGEGGNRHQRQRSTTLGSVMEFNFDSADGVNCDEPDAGPDWWANEKVNEKDNGKSKNWSFFPMAQPGVS